MSTLKDDDVAINLKLLKQCQFYQIFDPSEIMIYGWNVHQLFYIVYTGVVQCFIIYGSVGLFSEDTDNKIDYFLITFTNLNILISFWRLTVYLYNANKVSDLFNVTRYDFFTSEQCVKYKTTLYNYRDKIRQFTNWYVILSIVVTIQWLMFPIAINMLTTSENLNVRYQNILNLNFGVTAYTYNQYFVIFYIIEVNLTLYIAYIFIMTNVLLISFCSAIMSQQDILVQAFKNLGHENSPRISYFEEFKSILHDQGQLNLKIKSFFSVVRYIVLLTVASNSASIILLTYRFIVRELVNYSIYCCNWTQMDLKFKKLLLLAMRMNDANNWVIKATPKKIVNLQIFACIMSMSYNVVSVMVKITNTKNNISE
ncbi:uncharacterized protein LOC132949713 [Metopolophium dirhodum]|uniref:uncharacterized protein LOC132949713 n=1 Tax=Metopolophium dirhodum TaxID=44670 RepID=UPI002990032C|nr:uncharacterized protein LOC132949713 [Metopolophium dirhodum]